MRKNGVLADHKKIIKKHGLWAGVRCLKNKGVSFDIAYRAVFGKSPSRT